jgi:putative ABC transport system permease protein
MTWTRLRRMFRPTERAEVDDELRFHIEMRTHELIDQGLEPARARAMAEERFGPVGPIENTLVESTRRRRQREDRAEALMQVRQDLSYAMRSLFRAPAFATASIATLALGIGAAIAVFTVVNGVLLRPLPYADPDRIHMIWIDLKENEAAEMWGRQLPLSSGFYADIERDAKSFEAVAAFRSWPLAIAATPEADAEPVAAARVRPALFDVLGVKPAAGRAFTPAEAVPGGPNVAMISHDLWQRKFGGDRGIVGRQVQLSGASFTITGVMPPGFSFPRGAELPAPLSFGVRTDVWTPLVFDSSDVQNYAVQNLSAIGKLPPGVAAAAAQAELTGLMKDLLKRAGASIKLEYQVVPMADQGAHTVKRALLILIGAVAFVLLIAAANVASLLVARVANRQRELAVRAALGAGRSRIARQLVTENLLLAGVGTTCGVLVAYWGTKMMLAMVPGSLPRADDVGLDWRVLSFAILVALVTGVVFGIAASYAVRWTRLSETLHAGDTRAAGSVRHRYGRRLLVAAEVAMSLLLLIGAALLTRSFIELQRVRPGFDASNVLTAGVGIPIAGPFQPLVNAPRWSATFDDLAARVSAAPGIVAAGAVSSLPLSGVFESGGAWPANKTFEPGLGPTAQYNVVAGSYFAAAGIRVLAGRTFDARDRAEGQRVIVVNAEYARKQFGSETDAIGRGVNTTFEFTRNNPPRIVVGVVENVKQRSLEDDPALQVYVPVTQMGYPELTFVLKHANGGTAAALAALRQAARAVNPAIVIRDIQPMEEVMATSLARQRFSMTLIGVFAAIALILAIVGLYGVLSLIVGQRRREIGVRLALGAKQRDVVRMVVGEGARVTALGVVAGIAAAIGATRVMASLLYGVATTDVLTYTSAALVVAGVALAATYVPARRAAQVDPKAALAAE